MVELKISLKNYDPKYKQFSGTIRPKSTPCPKFWICILGTSSTVLKPRSWDPSHEYQGAKNLNKNKKIVQKLAKKCGAFWPLSL
jgi:large subunit ribosomal protein L10Ae